MSRPKNPHAVALGRLRKGVLERKTPTKKAAVRANLVLAREALAAKRAEIKAAKPSP